MHRMLIIACLPEGGGAKLCLHRAWFQRKDAVANIRMVQCVISLLYVNVLYSIADQHIFGRLWSSFFMSSYIFLKIMSLGKGSWPWHSWVIDILMSINFEWGGFLIAVLLPQKSHVWKFWQDKWISCVSPLSPWHLSFYPPPLFSLPLIICNKLDAFACEVNVE